jgi:phosphoribosylcarboxyaminoimidazole (NCAIR) mutase
LLIAGLVVGGTSDWNTMLHAAAALDRAAAG